MAQQMYLRQNHVNKFDAHIFQEKVLFLDSSIPEIQIVYQFSASVPVLFLLHVECVLQVVNTFGQTKSQHTEYYRFRERLLLKEPQNEDDLNHYVCIGIGSALLYYGLEIFTSTLFYFWLRFH